jgi:hypothetical protein
MAGLKAVPKVHVTQDVRIILKKQQRSSWIGTGIKKISV